MLAFAMTLGLSVVVLLRFSLRFALLTRGYAREGKTAFDRCFAAGSFLSGGFALAREKS